VQWKPGAVAADRNGKTKTTAHMGDRRTRNPFPKSRILSSISSCVSECVFFGVEIPNHLALLLLTFFQWRNAVVLSKGTASTWMQGAAAHLRETQLRQQLFFSGPSQWCGITG
jgi:hypothetical protein